MQQVGQAFLTSLAQPNRDLGRGPGDVIETGRGHPDKLRNLVLSTALLFS